MTHCLKFWVSVFPGALHCPLRFRIYDLKCSRLYPVALSSVTPLLPSSKLIRIFISMFLFPNTPHPLPPIPPSSRLGRRLVVSSQYDLVAYTRPNAKEGGGGSASIRMYVSGLTSETKTSISISSRPTTSTLISFYGALGCPDPWTWAG